MEIWECPDCLLQMVQDKKNVDSGGHKYGCPACEVERLNQALDRIGFYCAGTEVNYVSDFVLRVKRGEVNFL
jgi:hypothetical protein